MLFLTFLITSTIVTAYSPEAAQTDNSPCTAARNYNICEALDRGERICAANFVPLNTRLFVEGYGECIVKDRMNKRHKTRVDILYKTRAEALRWGRQSKKIYLIK